MCKHIYICIGTDTYILFTRFYMTAASDAAKARIDMETAFATTTAHHHAVSARAESLESPCNERAVC